VVVVCDVDRLTRNQSDWSRFEKAAVEQRVLLSARAGGDLGLSTPEGAYHRGWRRCRQDERAPSRACAPGRLPRRLPGWSPVREMPRCVLVPSVRPAVRVRALSADAREGRDGTTLGMITHGDRSSAVRGRRRSSRRAPFPRSGEVGAVRLGPPTASREKEGTSHLVTGQTAGPAPDAQDRQDEAPVLDTSIAHPARV